MKYEIEIPDHFTIKDLKQDFLYLLNNHAEECEMWKTYLEPYYRSSMQILPAAAECNAKNKLFSAFLRDRDQAGHGGRSLDEIKELVMAQVQADLDSYRAWDKKRARIIEGRYPVKGEEVLPKASKLYLAKDLVKPDKKTSGQRVRVVVTGFETHDVIMTDAESISFLEQLNARKEAHLKALGWEWKWRHGKLDVIAGDRENEPDKISVSITKHTDWV